MSRRRYVSTKISHDAKINRLATQYGDFAALLYTWMIPHAEDDATLSGNPEELLMTVMPGRRDKDISDIEAALQGMCELGLVTWTREGAHPAVKFPESFYDYQSYIKEDRRGNAQPKNKAASSAETSAPERTSTPNSAKQRKTAQNIASFSSSFSVSSSPNLGVIAKEGESNGASKEGEPLARPRTPSRSAAKSIEPEAQTIPKPINPIWDVLVEVFWPPTTKDERSLFGKVVKELRDIGASPDDIRERVKQHQKTQSHWDLTPKALVTHWSQLGVASRNGMATNGANGAHPSPDVAEDPAEIEARRRRRAEHAKLAEELGLSELARPLPRQVR